MTQLTILEVPNPILKKKTAVVAHFDDRLMRLLDDMLETMYEAPGIGLAAPQVGILERIVVIDTSENKDAPLRMINPEIIWHSDNIVVAEEGCLSLPKQFAEVKRFDEVAVAYMDEKGQQQTVKSKGITARCLQHELDHLDGILFTDHISALKRSMIMRRLAKARRQAS